MTVQKLYNTEARDYYKLSYIIDEKQEKEMTETLISMQTHYKVS